MRYFIENVKTYKSTSGVTKYGLYTSTLRILIINHL